MAVLSGKKALVTGASRGIGRAIAERLAADGAEVVVHYGRDFTAAKETVTAIEREGGGARAVQADLSVEDAVDTLFAGFDGEFDILVNNAGVGASWPIEATTPERFDEVFSVNTRALFFLTQRALTRLRDGGRIINITSGVTRIAFPEGIAYAMTKGAVETFTKALAKQLGERRITVNNVAPGIVDTDINAAWLRGNPDAQAYAASRAALGRVADPADIADTVAFLASPDGRWVTGTTLDATGGSHL